MEYAMRRVDGLRGLAAAAVSIALLLGAGALQTVAADQDHEPVVAFAYDPGSDALLKAYAKALYRSSDGGQSWQKIATPSADEGRIAGVTASSAHSGAMYLAGPGLGVSRTEDGGKTWVERSEGLPSRQVAAVAAHATQPDTVYVFVRGSGIYRSQDAAKSWRLMDKGPQEGVTQLIHSNMPGSMQTGWLFAATSTGIRRVMDCFCLWQDAGKLGSDVRSVTYDPRTPEQLYAVTSKGIFRSPDGGEDWTQVTSPGSKVAALAFAHSGILYAIGEDGALSRSTDQGKTWSRVHA